MRLQCIAGLGRARGSGKREHTERLQALNKGPKAVLRSYNVTWGPQCTKDGLDCCEAATVEGLDVVTQELLLCEMRGGG